MNQIFMITFIKKSAYVLLLWYNRTNVPVRNDDMKAFIMNAMQTKATIVIYYLDRHGKITQRYIRVLQLTEDHVLAFCFYRKKVRTFKLENMLSADKIRKRTGA